ncbi:hypothetical protein [Microcoleus sp. herbarium12]|uniref:hypothetical protein n=1 Tax=Microcoleus sp. herbarium12 TaxID=3055437 RepID=UPI002FCEACC1
MPLKTGDRNGDPKIEMAIGSSISAARAIGGALIRSGKRLFHDFGISRRKLFLKFGLHDIHLSLIGGIEASPRRSYKL